MKNKQLNLSFKPTNYEVLCKAYKKAISKQKGTVQSFNEWARSILMGKAKRITKTK